MAVTSSGGGSACATAPVRPNTKHCIASRAIIVATTWSPERLGLMLCAMQKSVETTNIASASPCQCVPDKNLYFYSCMSEFFLSIKHSEKLRMNKTTIPKQHSDRVVNNAVASLSYCTKNDRPHAPGPQDMRQ